MSKSCDTCVKADVCNIKEKTVSAIIEIKDLVRNQGTSLEVDVKCSKHAEKPTGQLIRRI